MPPCDTDPATGAGDGGKQRGPHVHGPTRDEPPSGSYVFSLPAKLAAPWLARTRIRDWLERHGFADEFVNDLEYAVSEAVSNAAEHAYPAEVQGGTIDVSAELITLDAGRLQVRVRVRDHGRWQPVDPTPRQRGHGLAAITAMTSSMTIRRGDSTDPGTEVEMLSAATTPAGRIVGSAVRPRRIE